MADGGSGEASPVKVVCPCCKQEVGPRKPVLLLQATMASKEALAGKAAGFSVFACQCGALFSPYTPELREEWFRRFGATKAQ